MTLDDLTEFHKRMLATCSDQDRHVHEDAVALLNWCIEIPCVDPSEHARSFALEMLIEVSCSEINAIIESHKGQDDEEVEFGHPPLRLWRGLNAKISERLWPVSDERAA